MYEPKSAAVLYISSALRPPPLQRRIPGLDPEIAVHVGANVGADELEPQVVPGARRTGCGTVARTWIDPLTTLRSDNWFDRRSVR